MSAKELADWKKKHGDMEAAHNKAQKLVADRDKTINAHCSEMERLGNLLSSGN
jgi:hypothetical protein